MNVETLFSAVSAYKALADEKSVDRLFRTLRESQVRKAPELVNEFEEKARNLPKGSKPSWGVVALCAAVLRLGVADAESLWGVVKNSQVPWSLKVRAVYDAARDGGGAAAAKAIVAKWRPKPAPKYAASMAAHARLTSALQADKLDTNDAIARAMRTIARVLAGTPAPVSEAPAETPAPAEPKAEPKGRKRKAAEAAAEAA